MFAPPLEPKELAERMKRARPLSDAFAQLRDHVVITDRDGHVLFANRAAEQETGYVLSEMLGHTPGELWGGHEHKEFYDELWMRVKTDKQPFAGVVHNRTKKGDARTQMLHISPILGVDHDVEFFVAIEPDHSQAEEADQARSALLSTIGSKSLGPATGVKWLLEMLSQQQNLTSEQRAQIASAAVQNEQLITLVQDMVYLSRDGQGHPSTEHIDVLPLLREAVRRTQKQCPHVRIVLMITGPVAAVVETNADVLGHLIRLLIDEPARRMETEGGTLTVVVGGDTDGCGVACTAATVHAHIFADELIAIIAASLGWPTPGFVHSSDQQGVGLHLPLVQS